MFLKGSVSGTVGFRFVQHFGTSGSPSSDVEVSTTAQAITTSWVKYTLTFTPASISGKTLGTDDNSSLQIFVDQKGNSGTFEGTVDFANEALVYGSVAYDQAFPTPAEERYRIDEYYQIIGDYVEGVAGARLLPTMPSQASSPDTVRRALLFFRRAMRRVPDITLGTPDNGTLNATSETNNIVHIGATAGTAGSGQLFDYLIADARL